MKIHAGGAWVGLSCLALSAVAQPFDIYTFDPTLGGPWLEPAKTTLTVPKVPNGSIVLDGAVTAAEYGGSQAGTVTPGEHAWILDFPADRAWDGAADSSFSFFLAHDDDHFYVGVQAKDDVVNSNDPNASFWKDDAIEIVVDALADRLDNNTDNSQDRFGGHSYVNFQGRFSAWDETANAIGSQTWATGVPWKYGAAEDVFGMGKAVAGGWELEVRFKKRLFEDPVAGNKLRNGYRMGFNIGMDDDDKNGPAPAGNGSRAEDLEIQYFWANRNRRLGYTADYLAALTPEQRATKVWLLSPDADPNGLPAGNDSNGRLSHGGTGEIIFGFDPDAATAGKHILFLTSNADLPPNSDPALIALLRAKGYTVTVMVPPAEPNELRAAAVGKHLVLISETIGSATVVDPYNDGTGVFTLKDTDVPVISFEAFMFDNADWVQRTTDGANDWINWGNTGRAELIEPAIQDARDSIYIRKAGHPIVGSLTGKVKVFDPPYSLNFGLPSADADVIASVQEDGTFPTLFVYEKGDRLVDGSTAPNKRIGLFVGQVAAATAFWPNDYADLTETGRTLILNTVAYAIGASAPPMSLAIAKNAGGVVITYAGGTLQSASVIKGGTWSNVTGASPVTVANPTGTTYYRVMGN